MKRSLITLVLLALTLPLLSACGGAKSGAAQQTIYVDVIPTHATDKYRQQMEKLGQTLSKQTGLPVEVRIGSDYATVVEAMRFGKSDVAYFGPFTYVVANAQSGANAFITMNIKGKPYYHSYAIVKKESPIQPLNDQGLATLKGKKIALGDPASTSSSQIPQLALQTAGLDRQKDVELVFTHAHDAVLKTVVAGHADIGFLDSAIFEGSLTAKFPKDVEQVRVVWKSVELYQYPWAHRKDLDPKVVAKLKAAFLKIADPEILEAFGADAFVEAHDALYDPVREAAKLLGIDLSKHELKKKK